eukprot:tig00000057_g63.t1
MIGHTVDHCHEAGWDLVVDAFLRRLSLSNHELLPYVLKVESILEQVDDSGREKHEKLIYIDIDAPDFVKELLGASALVIHVKVELDRAAHFMTARSTNASLSSHFRVTDECVWTRHPLRRDWTWLVQRCEIEVHGVPAPIDALVEKASKSVPVLPHSLFLRASPGSLTLDLFALKSYLEKVEDTQKLDRRLIDEGRARGALTAEC